MEKVKQKKNLDLKLLGRVLSLTKPYKTLFIFCLILAVVLGPVSMIRPFIIGEIVDNHITGGAFEGIWFYVWVYIGLLVINVILRYSFVYSTALLGQSVIKDLRVKIFNHITGLKSRFFDQTPIGTATTRTINDVETINTLFGQGFLVIIADILSVLAALGIMFYTSWRLTVICLTTLPLLIYATYVFKEKVKAAFQIVRNEIARMNAFLQERITGMRVLQIFNAEAQEMEAFKEINRSYTQSNLNTIFYYAIFFPVVELIWALAMGLMVWWGTKGYMESTISFGALVVFPMYLSMVIRPIRMLADKFNTLQMGLVAADRIYGIIDNNRPIGDTGSLTKENLDGHISFENVNFAYDDVNYVVNDLSLDIQPGETLAIVGSTGSGKTTIINILNRFYEIQSGDIKIDGVSINEYDLGYLRARMAMVLQDVFLFTGTIYENISLKDKNISLEEVQNAAKMIGAHAFIEDMPDAYEFKVTERGLNLSVGQRQLISFVRALVFNPSILILDEATSSIDSETESIIQYAIERLIEKRTSIIIAHRLSTIRHADKILVMDDGRMLEYGTHDELLQIESGKYKELYEMQYEELQV